MFISYFVSCSNENICKCIVENIHINHTSIREEIHDVNEDWKFDLLKKWEDAEEKSEEDSEEECEEDSEKESE